MGDGKEVEVQDWDLTKVVPSLHPGSTSVYVQGQIRQSGDGMIRLQGQSASSKKKWEDTIGPVSASLVDYISSLPHNCASIANSGTAYARCQFRLEKPGYLRVQIAGPKLNQSWGAEFIISCGHAASPWITGQLLPSSPPPPLAVFKIGDKVVIAKRGDGNGCEGGPPVGTVGKIAAHPAASACGEYEFIADSDQNGVGSGFDYTWITTGAHLKAVVPVSPPTHLFADPPSWATFGFASAEELNQFEKNHGHNAKVHCAICGGLPNTCYQLKLCKSCFMPFGQHTGGTGHVICPSAKPADDMPSF